jgi:hypothetical protein
MTLLPEAREAPEVKAHAGAGDRVKNGGLCHQFQPTACAIRKGFYLIAEGRGGAAVEEYGQVDLWIGAVCQTAHRPADPRERRGVVLNSGQAHGDPERQPIWTNPVTREPAEIGSLDQGKPVPPSFRAALQPVVQCADATGHTGKTRGMARLCFPPLLEDFGFTRFGPWFGRQIIRLLFHRTGQEPKIVLRRLFHLLTVEDESIIFIM